MAQATPKVELNDQQRQELLRIVRASSSAQRNVRRARIVLLRADGKSQEETARVVGVNRPVVGLWEQRFRSQGLGGLKDAPGRGRKASIAPQTVQRVLTEAVQPPPGRTRWSVRSMARHAKISPAQVQRIWSANDIKPHVLRTFKLSDDKDFEAKFWDVIGLYLNPPPRPTRRWCCAATRSRNARPCSAPSPGCRWASGTSEPARTTTFATAPSRCSPL